VTKASGNRLRQAQGERLKEKGKGQKIKHKTRNQKPKF